MKADLSRRVIDAAEAAFADHSYVSVIDVFCGMGLLAPSNVEAWRKGRLDCLESMIQGSFEKRANSLNMFWRWAQEKGLKPTETQYVRGTRNGPVELRFSVSGDPAVEKTYRTHFVSPALSERKQQQLQEKLHRPPETVVFQVLRDSQCSECGTDIERDNLLLMEEGQPLCMACARLDDLEYLGAGDATLTRRATKYSVRKAVVVRFSRSRKRCERQGVLVEQAALQRAEQECLEDAAERAAARECAAVRRGEEDRAFVARLAAQIAGMFPGCPPREIAAIAEHTAQRGSGRVGRSAAGRNLEDHALTAAVVAAVRHNHTNYDELLARGVDRTVARQRVAEKVDAVLQSWRT